MMLSPRAAKGVALASSFSRNAPTRSMSSPSLGSCSRRCERASSASKRTWDPLVLEERPAMGAPLYASPCFPHTARHEEYEPDREALREAGNQCKPQGSRPRRHPRVQDEAGRGSRSAQELLADGRAPVPHVRGEQALAPHRAPG